MGDSKQRGKDTEKRGTTGSRHQGNENGNQSNENDYGKGNILDSDFINLDDLVYAPLHALAESNHKLRSEVINNIQSMANTDNKNNEEIYELKKINIAYNQVRADVDDSYSVDKLQVQVPLLSIVPVTNLGIEEAEIGFSTEVRTQENLDKTERKFEARVCSPEQRNSDFLPRVSYKMKVKSIPATEGIMRLVDALSANQVAKKLESQIISPNGNSTDRTTNEDVASINNLKNKVTKLRLLYSKVSDALDEMEQLNKIKSTNKNSEEGYDKNFFENKKTDIVNEILRYKDMIMKKEISCAMQDDPSTNQEANGKSQEQSN